MSASEKCSASVPASEGLAFWTFDLVEERLIEAAALWNRAPRVGAGGGYATDGPWHLVLREWGDWDAHEDKPLRPAQLTRYEVGRRDEATAWVEAYVEPEEDRRILWLALYQKADGRRPDWAWIMKQIGWKRGRDGVRMRYRRVVTRVAQGLDNDKIAVRPALLS
jgi:hypothetical protein